MEIIALTIAMGVFAKYLECKLESTFSAETEDVFVKPKSIYDNYTTV